MEALYLIVKCLITLWTDIHIVIHKEDIVCRDKRTQLVERQTNTNVRLGMCIRKSLFLHPFQGAIRTIVDVNQYLMLIGGILADALHA